MIHATELYHSLFWTFDASSRTGSTGTYRLNTSAHTGSIECCFQKHTFLQKESWTKMILKNSSICMLLIQMTKHYTKPKDQTPAFTSGGRSKWARRATDNFRVKGKATRSDTFMFYTNLYNFPLLIVRYN